MKNNRFKAERWFCYRFRTPKDELSIKDSEDLQFAIHDPILNKIKTASDESIIHLYCYLQKFNRV